MRLKPVFIQNQCVFALHHNFKLFCIKKKSKKTIYERLYRYKKVLKYKNFIEKVLKALFFVCTYNII